MTTPRLVRYTVDGTPRVIDLFRYRPQFPHLTVTDFGVAHTNTAAANQTGLTTALAEAKTQGLPLYVPAAPAPYAHSGRLTVDSVVLFSISPSAAVLHGTTTVAHALDLTGTAPGLHGLTITGPGKAPRTSDRGGNGVYVNAATGYVVRNCAISDVSGAGIMVENGQGGLVRNNLVQRTGADGIYHTEGSTSIEVAYNRTVATGDDALSVTSYDTAAGFCSNVDIHHNTVVGNFESRAITVNGCNGGIVIRDNHIDGGTAGIAITSVAEWLTLSSTGVDVYGNTIRNINQSRQDTGHIGGGAFTFWNDVTGGSDSGLSCHDNRIYDPGLYGIFAGGSQPIAASVSSNAFYMDAGLTLASTPNGSATITQSPANTRELTTAYPGALVASTVGGLDLAYRYAPA